MKFLILSLLFSLSISTNSFAAPFKTILLTGGNGYIGSHIAVELLEEGYHVIIVDNLANSSPVVTQRISQVTQRGTQLEFFPYDLRDKEKLEQIFQDHKIDAVIHLAGLKAVGESVTDPISYYDNNLISTIYLLETMKKYHCRNLVFSSSATVYGTPKYLPMDESHPVAAVNPYGRTKLQIEEILADTAASDKNWRLISLRYFNPSGAHQSGLLGESPRGIPNNLMPYVLQVVAGKREKLKVFGSDYPTKDGTGVRDFIHVVDLSKGHLATLHKLENDEEYTGHKTYNLGTGKGYSVLEIVGAVSEAIGKPLPYEHVDRRSGDVSEVFADVSLAEKELNWKALYGLQEMIKDSLNWIRKNPEGYPEQNTSDN